MESGERGYGEIDREGETGYGEIEEKRKKSENMIQGEGKRV